MATQSPTTVCPTCGNGLEPSGICNVCLLHLGITQTGADPRQPSEAELPNLKDLNAQFPQLEITRLVGRGGMGAIYHARQTTLDRDVALKLIAKEVSSDTTFVERFEREAKTLAKLSHPNIVTIFDFGHTPDGTAYLILEYVDGINLREAISSGSVGSDEALEVVSKICGALEYAHSKGVVHRDIKPENILLGEDGTLKVADFGIAKIVDDSVRVPTLTATRQVLGSLHYLAPEHLEAPDQVDHRVDLYALGVVFYELLTGQLPLGRYEAPSKLKDRVDHRLDAIVLKSLSRKPDQRYQNAAELDSAIVQVATSINDRPAPPYSPPQSELPLASASGGSVSVPFTCEASDGMSEANGVLHVRGDSLCAEFRIRNVWGIVKAKTHVVDIPRRHLARVALVHGFLGSKLVVVTDTISALGEFPNAETGQVELKIKRNDEGYAREVAHAVGFDSIQTVGRKGTGGPIEWPNELSDSKRIMIGVLLILCGILNGGALAVYEYIFVNQLKDEWLVGAAIAAAVLLAPLVILQVVTGILNLVGPARTLTLTTSALSMVPITPVWFLSLPIGMWAFRALQKGDDAASIETTSEGKQNWGTTTLLFIRESRWATATGMVNVALGVVFIAGVLAFKFGYYPADVRYRVIDPDVQYRALEKAVQVRLQESFAFRGIKCDQVEQPTRMTVKTWYCYRDHVESLLSVQENPQLVWLESNESAAVRDADTATSGEQTIAVLSGLDTSSFRATEHHLGTALHVVRDSFELSSDLVGKVSTARNDDEYQIILELTASGREQLTAQAGNESAGGLGLVIRGLVEGVAAQTSISQKQIVFQLSDSSELTQESIVAGIRGPNVPTQLELLE